MFQHPLNLANPDGDAGQLRRIRINLDAMHGLRADRRKLGRQPQHFGFEDDLVLNILEGAQREVEKISGSAGWIQHPKIAKTFEEMVISGLGFLAGFALVRGYLGLGPIPRFKQRFADHRINDTKNGMTVGVVRPQLAPLGGVESTFEQRAENGRFDAAPVQPGYIQQ